MSDYKTIPKEIKNQRRFYAVIFIVIVLLYIIATIQTKFNPFIIFFNMGNFFDFLMNDLLPPRINISRLGGLMLQNIGMSIIPTFFGGIISFCLSFAASYSTSKNRTMVAILRGIASFQRNLPSAIWLMLLVMAFGIGTSVGIIALTINTVGYLLRGFADVLDEVGIESIEALDSVGAGYFPKLFRCVIPAALPGFISWLLYAIEINILSSSVIGAVGGGGIGMIMMAHWKMFQFKTSFGIILSLGATVIAVNAVTNYLRKKVIA